MPSGVSSDGWKKDQDAESMDDNSSSAPGSWGYLKDSKLSSSLSWWLNAWLLFSASGCVTSLDLLPGLFFQFLESPILLFFAMAFTVV